MPENWDTKHKYPGGRRQRDSLSCGCVPLTMYIQWMVIYIECQGDQSMCRSEHEGALHSVQQHSAGSNRTSAAAAVAAALPSHFSRICTVSPTSSTRAWHTGERKLLITVQKKTKNEKRKINILLHFSFIYLFYRGACWWSSERKRERERETKECSLCWVSALGPLIMNGGHPCVFGAAERRYAGGF